MSDMDVRECRLKTATAGRYTFAEEDIETACKFVETNFMIQRDDRQFDAVLCFLCRKFSLDIERYGRYGCDDPSVVAGRNPVEYWLDQHPPLRLLQEAREKAVLCPMVEVELSTNPASSAKQCKVCKTKFERGELVSNLHGWVGIHGLEAQGSIAAYKHHRYCFAPTCLAQLKVDFKYYNPAIENADQMIATAAFGETLCPEARDVAEAAFRDRTEREQKPRFEIVKKRKARSADTDVPTGFSPEAEANFLELDAAWVARREELHKPPPRCACGNFALSREVGATCNACAC